MKCLKYLLIFVAAVKLVSAEISLINGTCPDYSHCKHLDLNYTFENIQGFHYVYAQTPFVWNTKSKCQFIHFVNQTSEGVISYENHFQNNLTNTEIISRGKMTITPEGKIITDYSESSYDGLTFPLQFQALALTSDYIITYTCLECGIYSKSGAGVYIQILSRLLSPKCSSGDKIMEKLHECGIPTEYLVFSDNRNCDTCNL